MRSIKEISKLHTSEQFTRKINTLVEEVMANGFQ